jgi:hypothetical protein
MLLSFEHGANKGIDEGDVMRTATTRRNSFSATIVVCYALIAFQFAAGVTASQATLTGTVSCAQCHGMHSGKGNTQLSCTILCVGQSSHYILIIGDKATPFWEIKTNCKTLLAVVQLLPAIWMVTRSRCQALAPS